MNHWVIAPVLGPMLVAVALLLTGRQWLQRLIAIGGSVLGAALMVWLVNRSRFDGMETYLPGNTLPPMGAVLVLDKVATLALALLALLHLAVLAHVISRGTDQQRPKTLVMLHLLISGLNGVVLAGDLASLWLFWCLTLVAFAGVAPGFRRVAAPGGVALAMALLLAALQGGSVNLADLSERASGASGLALAALACWAVGFAAMLLVPLGAVVGLGSVVVAGRLMLLVPMEPWFMPAALFLALALTFGAWRNRSVRPVPLAAAVCSTVALYLLAQPRAPATEAGLWLLLVAALWSTGALLVPVLILVPAQRRRAAQAALGLLLAAPIILALLLPGKIPTRFAAQINAIARQLHQPDLYITAVIGLPDRPMLVPEPDL